MKRECSQSCTRGNQGRSVNVLDLRDTAVHVVDDEHVTRRALCTGVSDVTRRSDRRSRRHGAAPASATAPPVATTRIESVEAPAQRCQLPLHDSAQKGQCRVDARALSAPSTGCRAATARSPIPVSAPSPVPPSADSKVQDEPTCGLMRSPTHSTTIDTNSSGPEATWRRRPRTPARPARRGWWWRSLGVTASTASRMGRGGPQPPLHGGELWPRLPPAPPTFPVAPQLQARTGKR